MTTEHRPYPRAAFRHLAQGRAQGQTATGADGAILGVRVARNGQKGARGTIRENRSRTEMEANEYPHHLRAHLLELGQGQIATLVVLTSRGKGKARAFQDIPAVNDTLQANGIRSSPVPLLRLEKGGPRRGNTHHQVRHVAPAQLVRPRGVHPVQGHIHSGSQGRMPAGGQLGGQEGGLIK